MSNLGNDLRETGFFIWKSDTTGGNRENCGSMTSAGFLDDFSCSEPAIFFCEISNWDDS